MATGALAAVDKIEESLATHSADRCWCLFPQLEEWDMKLSKKNWTTGEYHMLNYKYPIPIGSEGFVQWALKNVLGTTAFIIKEKPAENTITPDWN